MPYGFGSRMIMISGTTYEHAIARKNNLLLRCQLTTLAILYLRLSRDLFANIPIIKN